MPVLTQECPNCGNVKPLREFPYRKGGLEEGAFCTRCHTISWKKSARVIAESGPKDVRAVILERSILNARAIGAEHRLTIEDIPTPSTCKYLGLVLEYGHRKSPGGTERRRWADNTASIDRIDSSKGYVPGNIQIISYLANRMKQDATVEQLLAFAEGVLRVHAPR